MKVGIVGLGLMGGSMAKSIKARTSHTVYGIDLDQETMSLARLCGAIDGPLTGENLAQCDLVLVALRPQAAIDWVREKGAGIPKGAILVDFCGVKRVVVEALAPLAEEYGFSYIGGHPMAGRERGGFTASTEDLYVGASMILTPDQRTDMKLLETLRDFFFDVGFGKLTFSQPEEHDRIIAFTSQLAHIVSSAYVKSPEAQRRRGFSAGSFRDMTRVARLDRAFPGRCGLPYKGAGHPHRPPGGVPGGPGGQRRGAPPEPPSGRPGEEGHRRRELDRAPLLFLLAKEEKEAKRRKRSKKKNDEGL